MLKIHQATLQQYENCELPDVQAGYRKGRGNRDQITNIHWTIKKRESSRKNLLLSLLTMPKPSTVWITTSCGISWKRWEYQTTSPATWEACMQVKKQQLETEAMKQRSVSKLGKEYDKAVYCHPAYLTYMLCTSCKMPCWTNHSWNQDCQEKY